MDKKTLLPCLILLHVINSWAPEKGISSQTILCSIYLWKTKLVYYLRCVFLFCYFKPLVAVPDNCWLTGLVPLREDEQFQFYNHFWLKQQTRALLSSEMRLLVLNHLHSYWLGSRIFFSFLSLICAREQITKRIPWILCLQIPEVM